MKAILTLAGVLTATVAALPAWSGDHGRQDNHDSNKPYEEQYDNGSQHPNEHLYGGDSQLPSDHTYGADSPYGDNHAPGPFESHPDDAIQHQADMTLYQAAVRISTELQRPISWVWLDERNPASPHYHFDVVLASGATARLQVDARSGAIGWRNPAILED